MAKSPTKTFKVTRSGLSTDYNAANETPFCRKRLEVSKGPHFLNMTLAEKIAAAEKEIIPRYYLPHLETPHDGFFVTDQYRPHADYWNGTCQKWGAWQAQNELLDLLTAGEGFYCGDFFFSNREIAEYLTAIYPLTIEKDADGSERWYGERSNPYFDPSLINQDEAPQLTKEIQWSFLQNLDELGYQTSAPHLIFKAIKEIIKKEDRMPTINRYSTGLEIWNQPVHQIGIKKIPLSEDQLENDLPLTIYQNLSLESGYREKEFQKKEKGFPYNPHFNQPSFASGTYLGPSFFYEIKKGKNGEIDSKKKSKIERTIRAIEKLDELLVTELIKFAAINKDLKSYYKNDFLNNIKTIKEEKIKKWKEVNPYLKIKEGFKIKEVTVKLHYLQEVDFLTPKNYFKKLNNRYLEIKDTINKKKLSTWVTKRTNNKGRVDYAFVGENILSKAEKLIKNNQLRARLKRLSKNKKWDDKNKDLFYLAKVGSLMKMLDQCQKR